MCKGGHRSQRVKVENVQRHHARCSVKNMVFLGVTAAIMLFSPSVDARLLKKRSTSLEMDPLRPEFSFGPCEENVVEKRWELVESVEEALDHSHQGLRRKTLGEDVVKRWGTGGMINRPRSLDIRQAEPAGESTGEPTEEPTGQTCGQCGTFNKAAFDAFCSADNSGEYDLGLHIGAIFIQIGVSFLGTMIPLLGRWIPALKMSDYVFSWFKNFGSGVILATGWIHMLIPGVESLTNPCLADTWLEYSSFAGLFAMVAVLFTQFIQTMALQHLKAYLPEDHDLDTKEMTNYQNLTTPPGNVESASQELTTHAYSHQQATTVSHTHGHDHGHSMHESKEENHVHTLLMSGNANLTKRHVTVYILEAGIATHSLIIGLALGVSRGDELVPLMIALAFHQFFEGIALSTTVLDAGFKTRFQPIFMVCFYSLTTPIGIAIGIALASSFNANDTASLLIMGIIESISAGILIYDALVNLISVQITNNPKFMKMNGWKKAGIFLALWLGAALMAVIGLWA